jgi:23S rRNA (cytosine1962-C5)-methyltransferase
VARRVALLVNPPCLLFEDEHLLVVNKPAGWNTHRPAPFAGEGIYDWLRDREPRWAALAIMHRLDKETSGVLVFSKTTLASRSLTEQFSARAVQKRYLLLTDGAVPQRDLKAVSCLVRAGERYVSRPVGSGSDAAETRFRLTGRSGAHTLVEAEPVTGRTHQIRVHAADLGFPILGDTLYGGTPAARVCLHAASIAFRHPATNAPVTFAATADFEADTRAALRAACVEPGETDAFRLVHGAADGWPGWYVDRLGQFMQSQSEAGLTAEQERWLRSQLSGEVRGVYHKTLARRVRQLAPEDAAPRHVMGEVAPGIFSVRENGVCYELSFDEGYSVGLFLDQRDNRRRFLSRHVAAGFPLFGDGAVGREVLNVFAYTCGFSVCAARAGARATSLDLSRKYLDWGRRNFALNGLDPAAHDFIFGDAFDWLRRLAKKGRAFDVVVLDPPTFSQSKPGGVFRAEKDYGRLAALAAPLVKPGGVLFASTNAAGVTPETFLETLDAALASAGRRARARHYAPQSPDYPVSRAEPAHLKTVWLRL